MKMKFKTYILKTCLLIFCFYGCGKRNFFPDPDDPGLSILSSKGFNVATSYINDTPYINPKRNILFGVLNDTLSLFKVVTNGPSDTLSFSWPIELNNGSDTFYNAPYQRIALLMPIAKSFTIRDLLALNGQQFNANTNSVVLFNYNKILSGNSNIYFVRINWNLSNSDKNQIIISGLFNANIGDSIFITKGRFDFLVSTDNLNF